MGIKVREEKGNASEGLAPLKGGVNSGDRANQGSLLFSKVEFSIKPDLRGLSFS